MTKTTKKTKATTRSKTTTPKTPSRLKTNSNQEKTPDVVKETYEEVLYSSSAFARTAIANMAGRAKLWGLNPAPVEKARVLELGCSFGGNIISQALYHPQATFTGIDLSSKQVEKGMEIIKNMGLTNVHLFEKNILDIDESFGTFDYIIVHGIWSWVPDVVKDKILNICNANLSDNGVAYVSYNTYPGWKRLEQFRDIMLYATKDKESMPLAERTIYGKKVLERLGQTMKLDSNVRTNQGYKIRNLETVLNANNYYVSHEYFEIFNDPVYFHEFARRAKEQGCAYIGDCTMSLSYASRLPDQIRDNIVELAEQDPIAKEQYIDYVYDTQFRCSLLTKGSNESKIRRDETADISILQNLYFLSRENKGANTNLTNTFHRSIKDIMDRGQLFQVQDIINHITATYPGIQINMDVVYARLFYLIVTGNIDVYTHAQPISTFEENRSYIPERYINYVTTLVDHDGNTYIGAANQFNNPIGDIDKGLLLIMNMLTKPTTRQKLLDEISSKLTFTRKTADGMDYQVSAEQYLQECLTKLTNLGYFTK